MRPDVQGTAGLGRMGGILKSGGRLVCTGVERATKFTTIVSDRLHGSVAKWLAVLLRLLREPLLALGCGMGMSAFTESTGG